MTLWQTDFYRRPLQDQAGHPLWELAVCAADRSFTASAFCPQPDANSDWLTQQLQQWMEQQGRPEAIQVFRSQAVSLLQAACQPLGIPVEPTRRTPALKQWLTERAKVYPTLPNYTGQPYDPVQLDQPPPVPLPENLWGDRWRFAAIAAGDLTAAFQHRPIPILNMPAFLLTQSLKLASTVSVPGVVIDGGRQSMPLAQWLQRSRPYALTYIPGEPDGLILAAGLVERWVLTTFTDPEVQAAAQTFQTRMQASKGLHFILVQPDDSGMTYTGFWLLNGQV